MVKTVQRTIVIIITIITIVVFAVIFDDDTYYWVYLSSEYLFQVYTKYDGLLLQSVTAFLLQSVVLLQSEIVITKCDNFITKCDRYHKERRLLQCETEQTQGFSCMLKKTFLGNYSVHDSDFVLLYKLNNV